MKNFCELPVLEILKKKIEANTNLSKVYLISVQHILETTGSLFEAIIDIGVNPHNIYLCGKIYSKHSETEKALKQIEINVIENSRPPKLGAIRESLKKDASTLWAMVMPRIKEGDTIIILDDGGLVIKRAPRALASMCKVYGIEQTTFGLRYQTNRIGHFPMIQVAKSAAKRYLEPRLISKALMKKLSTTFERIHPKRIGVIGFGNIGKAVTFQFEDRYKVFVYDKNLDVTANLKNGITLCKSADEVILNCDVIIGASGSDISRHSNWEELVKEDKFFISVSSSDIEFNFLLRKYSDRFRPQNHNFLSPITVQLENGYNLTFIRGGTVANFDNSKESCPAEEIQLTRGLLLAGVIQALNDSTLHKSNLHGSIVLDPKLQMVVVQEWFTSHPRFKSYYPKDLIEKFHSEMWIKENSADI
jgi:S-adenosylhomocysteine hydrolase